MVYLTVEGIFFGTKHRYMSHAPVNVWDRSGLDLPRLNQLCPSFFLFLFLFCLIQ